MLHEARGEDLIDTWTLVDADWRLVANKHGATRLGFALLLKFFESEARFPRDLEELPVAAVAYVAEQVKGPGGPARRVRLVRPHGDLPSHPDPRGVRLPDADSCGRDEAGRVARERDLPGRDE